MKKGAKMEIVNLSEFRKSLAKLTEAARGRATTEAVESGATVLEGEIKVNIELQKLVDTANLLNSWQVQSITETGAGVEAIVGTDVVYAAIHEFGGVIYQTSAKRLVQKDKNTGEERAAPSVTIPARPYVRPAIDENRVKIRDAMAAAIERNIRQATNG